MRCLWLNNVFLITHIVEVLLLYMRLTYSLQNFWGKMIYLIATCRLYNCFQKATLIIIFLFLFFLNVQVIYIYKCSENGLSIHRPKHTWMLHSLTSFFSFSQEEIAQEAETGKIYPANYFDKYGRVVLVLRPGFQVFVIFYLHVYMYEQNSYA